MPDCIEGKKAESLVEELIQSIPKDLPKTKRNRLIKEKIKVAFHLDDGPRPSWVQGSDWPFSETGKPLKYLSRKRYGDLVQYTFVDVETGETTVVEEFY